MSHLTMIPKVVIGASLIVLSACSTTGVKSAKSAAVQSTSLKPMQSTSAVLSSAPDSVRCWNGCRRFSLADCPPEPQAVTEIQCWDGALVSDVSQCTTQQSVSCWDGTVATDASQCRPQPVTRSQMSVVELCGQEYRAETIYYEFDKGASAETQAKIDRILDVGQFCNVDSITVIGHTDTTGSAAYNMTLSEKRAADARAALVRDGIDARRITSLGKGETENAIDRGDNVKEQLNRRTEVLIKLSETGAIMPSN